MGQGEITRELRQVHRGCPSPREFRVILLCPTVPFGHQRARLGTGESREIHADLGSPCGPGEAPGLFRLDPSKTHGAHLRWRACLNPPRAERQVALGTRYGDAYFAVSE